MQNLTVQCGLCLRSPVFYPTIVPYLFISLPANGWVMWLMVSSPVFWTDKMEVFEFHLVITEMIFGVLGPPLLAIRHFSDFATVDGVTKLINLIFTARVQFQSCVCVERYVAVLRPVLYRRYKPLRYKMSFCCVLWLTAILIGIIQMLFCSHQKESIDMHKIYFLSVLIVNSFCSLSILRALKQPSPGEGEREGSKLIKKRAFNIILIFQVSAFVGYVPLLTMFFLVGKIEMTTLCILQPLANSVMVWLGVVYPLLYFRRAGKHLLRNGACVGCFRL